jgi:hypothetical protein
VTATLAGSKTFDELTATGTVHCTYGEPTITSALVELAVVRQSGTTTFQATGRVVANAQQDCDDDRPDQLSVIEVRFKAPLDDCEESGLPVTAESIGTLTFEAEDACEKNGVDIDVNIDFEATAK